LPRAVAVRPRQAGLSKALRGLHGALDIGFVGVGQFGPGLRGGRVEAVEGLAGLGIDPLAVDAHLEANECHATIPLGFVGVCGSRKSSSIWLTRRGDSTGIICRCSARTTTFAPGMRRPVAGHFRGGAGVEFAGGDQRRHLDAAQVVGAVHVLGGEQLIGGQVALRVVAGQRLANGGDLRRVGRLYSRLNQRDSAASALASGPCSAACAVRAMTPARCSALRLNTLLSTTRLCRRCG
jgi:hypothetical protein